jgi:hypothetical protein
MLYARIMTYSKVVFWYTQFHKKYLTNTLFFENFTVIIPEHHN